jgi:fermentation-respiration switch protein FrsA (DUF1100 family)
MAKSTWTWLFQPVGWLTMSDYWAPGDRVKDLAGTPLVVIHSKKDEIIPYDLGEKIFATAGEPKLFWSKERGGHNQTFDGPEGEALKGKLLQAFLNTGAGT